MTGWIAIHRKIRDHWVYSNDSYFRAWITILMEVNHSPQKVLIRGTLYDCGIGESLNSLGTWGTLFGSWSKKKVSTFFSALEKDRMIVVKSEGVTTRLTVCNYLEYQKPGNAAETQGKRSGNARETQGKRKGDTNNNDNNENNSNNANNDTSFAPAPIGGPTHIEKAKPQKKKPAKPKGPTIGSKTWEAYSDAYFHRYGTKPVRNQKTNSVCKQLGERLGDAAPEVARFFVWLNTQWYINKGHQIATLLADAEKVHTEWATNTRITNSGAREADRIQEQGDSWGRVIQEMGE